jgi:hypothetical protein
VSASLGPKASFYRDAARDAWRTPLAQGEVRQALFAGVMGTAMLAAGIAFLRVTSEAFVALCAGLIAVAYAAGILRERWPALRAWWAVGAVALSLPEATLHTGRAATVTAVVRPRRRGSVARAALTVTPSTTGTATLPPGETAWEFPFLSAGTPLTPGVRLTHTVPVALPSGAMSSYYATNGSRRWTLVAELELADGARWRREFPLLVVPSP